MYFKHNELNYSVLTYYTHMSSKEDSKFKIIQFSYYCFCTMFINQFLLNLVFYQYFIYNQKDYLAFFSNHHLIIYYLAN